MKKCLILYLFLFLVSLGCFVFANNQLALILAIVLFVVYLGMLLYLRIVAKQLTSSYRVASSCKTLAEMSIFMEITNHLHLPLGKIECVFEFTNHLFKSQYIETAYIEPSYHQSLYEIIHHNPYCGKVSMCLKEIRVYDLLSLHYKTIKLDQVKNYFVYPPFYEINVLAQNELHKNDIGDNFSQNFKGNDSSEVFDLREYQTGDSVKQIHWKISTKLEKLMIKEFAHPSSFHTMIMCDAIIDEGHWESVNAMLGTVISLSDQFTKKETPHYVGYYDGKLKNIQVNNQNDYIAMIDAFLSSSLEENAHRNIDCFLTDERYYSISEVIYLTNHIDDHLMELLSLRVSLTVICIQKESYLEQRPGYQIVSLNMDNLASEQTNIII